MVATNREYTEDDSRQMKLPDAWSGVTILDEEFPRFHPVAYPTGYATRKPWYSARRVCQAHPLANRCTCAQCTAKRRARTSQQPPRPARLRVHARSTRALTGAVSAAV